MAAHKIKVMLIEIESKFDAIISSDSFATNYVKNERIKDQLYCNTG